MRSFLKRSNVVIERVSPEVDGGRYRAKAIVGDSILVSADIFRDGAHVLQAAIRHRGPSDQEWSESTMSPGENHHWQGTFQPTEIGRHKYTIEAWTDAFGTWRRDLRLRVEADQNVDMELEEGALLLESRLELIPPGERSVVQETIETIRTNPAAATEAALGDSVAKILARTRDPAQSSVYEPELELTVDRERARFGAWYELFPRSTGESGEHGTFKTASKRLRAIAEMGFDVVYLPPIHPIGTTHRKGKDNALVADADDVGSPWAIGSKEGGHAAIHAQLGTSQDFDEFVAEAQALGMEVALDFAIQCSPDHPWVREHPEWFHHQPDGSIKFAENPPKKYQDIYPVNFDTANKQELWEELKRTVEHWISHGVKIFRVDNPHTKPFPFWEWLISAIKEDHPDVIFLSEAFTAPPVMKALSKLGFTQSYTYFTWKNTKWELIDYMTELTRTEMVNYFRPNFFTNTPDILHEYLQKGGPPAFKIRLTLAATLSPSYGVYSGFELFENTAYEEGSEEYANSEKYELRPRLISSDAGLVPYIRKLNEIRHKHPVLSYLPNLVFHGTDNDQVLAYSKTGEGQDPLLLIVTLNPHWPEETAVHLNLEPLGLEEHEQYSLHDLLSADVLTWHGAHNHMRIDPSVEPARIFVLRR